MNPALTLFKKEFHQHGIFAPAMVCMCLLFQLACYEWCYFFNATIDVQTYFSLAIVLTALYAGAAAALAYSTEHAENTFIFLRKMPISPTTIALGKAGWVICGTLLVFLGNLLLALIWTGGYLDGQIAYAVGFGIVEALVWGLFWSPRCRNQVNALLATYLCAAGTIALLGNVFQPNNPVVVEVYIALMPYRAVVMLLIGYLAIRGMLRWFEYEAKPSVFSRLFPEKMTFRYPRGVQIPFFALMHQHLRHASLLYPLGILCFVAWTVVCSYLWAITVTDISGWYSSKLKFMNSLEWRFAIGGCVTGMALFWATIFSHDQKNDSYRFLSRLGIHEGKVWWSRLLPALVMYSPVLISILGFVAAGEWRHNGLGMGNEMLYFALWYFLPASLAVWLTPVAVGAFVSISLRSQMVAIALTAVGMSLPLFWMALTAAFLGCSPWWATLPIILTLLLASRIRAAYWLRETFTWRSRFIPLVPMFATMLVILIAIPFARVYSVPDLSWERIEAYFDKMDLPERPEPEKLKALLQHVKEKEGVPSEYNNVPPHWNSRIQWYGYGDKTSTYEEYVLLYYASSRQDYNQSLADMLAYYHRARSDKHYSPSLISLVWQSAPWERARVDRMLRLYIVATLSQSGGLQEESGKRMELLYNRLRQSTMDNIGLPYLYHDAFANNRCHARLTEVCTAIDSWYKEHGTLPVSLDDLVGTFLDKLPVHPFTGASVAYHLNSPPIEAEDWQVRNNTYVFTLGTDPDEKVDETGRRRADVIRHSRDSYAVLLQTGGTYVRLGNVIVIVEPEKAGRQKSGEEEP